MPPACVLCGHDLPGSSWSLHICSDDCLDAYVDAGFLTAKPTIRTIPLSDMAPFAGVKA